MKKSYYFVLLCLAFLVLLTPLKKETALHAEAAVKQPIKITLSGDFKTTVPQMTIEIKITSDHEIQEVRYASKSIAKISDFQKKNKSTELLPTKENMYSVTISENGFYSFYVKDKKGNETYIKKFITCIDSIAPQMTIHTSEQESNRAYEVSFNVKDKSKIISLTYLKGAFANAKDDMWKQATAIENNEVLLSAGKYSFRAEDIAGNTTVEIIYIGDEPKKAEELKAVWISYLEFTKAPYTEKSWKKQIDTMFNQVIADGMNAVIVHVRPFSDALYPSSYYPWSSYISGTQGKNPGFDPLQYMVTAAHERGLAIHAWLNPYRITSNTTDVTTLSKDHPARVWRTDSSTKNDRNVIAYGGKLYYNPASSEVRELIVNGVKELVTNYELDGIHFDDYFYPSLGKNYETNFDAKEYKTYCKNQEKTGEVVLSIADWRRENVNMLVRDVYATVKQIDKTVEFGISPGGFIDYLTMDDRYYVDYETWLGYDGYIDYLCPQLYWSNNHSKFPFNETLQRFLDARKNPDVKVYVGIAAYKAGLKSEEPDWYQDKNILKNMISFPRTTNEVDGFMFFRYDFFVSKKNNTAIKNMLTELKKTK